MEESYLIKRAQKGDKEALIGLVMDRKDEFYRLAYVYMGNPEDSMDAMQDMIVILYENIHRLKNTDSFYTWSKTILVNCCRNILRKRKKVVLIDEYEDAPINGDYENTDTRNDILMGIKSLNSHQQEAIKLRFFLDLDYETISRVTNVPLGTVKSRVFNGLSKLREIFGGEY